MRSRPIMILDEAISALEAEAEKQAFSALRALCPQTAIIAVSRHPHNIPAGYRPIMLGKQGGYSLPAGDKA